MSSKPAPHHQQRPRLTNWKLISKAPVIRNPKYKKLAPAHSPTAVEFHLENVLGSIANGIRRIICSEIPVIAMTTDFQHIETDDERIIPEMVLRRLNEIPLLQSCPQTTTWQVDVSNNTGGIINVTAADITAIINTPHRNAPRPGNASKVPSQQDYVAARDCILCTLEPGTHLAIAPIRVDSFIGSAPGQGHASVATRATSVPLSDAKNPRQSPGDPTYVLCGVRNDQNFILRFETNNDSESPSSIVRRAIAIFRQRLKAVLELVPAIKISGENWELSVQNETHTIGEALSQAILALYPNVAAVSYRMAAFDSHMILRGQTEFSAPDVLTSAVTHLDEILQDLDSQVSTLAN